MGYYIDPLNISKEEFLSTYGKLWDESQPFSQVPHGMLPVCLIDNLAFTAAAICNMPREYDCFRFDRTGRYKQFYIVPVQFLQEYL